MSISTIEAINTLREAGCEVIIADNPREYWIGCPHCPVGRAASEAGLIAAANVLGMINHVRAHNKEG